MSEEVKQEAIIAYNKRSEDIKDFNSCVIIDKKVPVVVTQNVVINFYHEYIYHPDIGLHPVSDELENLTCKDAIDYISGNGCDIKKAKAKVLKSKKSKRTAPDPKQPNTKSKRTLPRPSRPSRPSKPSRKSKRTK